MLDSSETFLRRAEDFARGMGLLREDEAYAQSAALLAIHAAIAYADALRVGLGDQSLSSDDHQTAAKSLCSRLPAEDNEGIGRLQKLLASKSTIAYGSRRVDAQRLRLICIESERFALWANRIGKTQVAGWRIEHD